MHITCLAIVLCATDRVHDPSRQSTQAGKFVALTNYRVHSHVPLHPSIILPVPGSKQDDVFPLGVLLPRFRLFARSRSLHPYLFRNKNRRKLLIHFVAKKKEKRKQEECHEGKELRRTHTGRRRFRLQVFANNNSGSSLSGGGKWESVCPRRHPSRIPRTLAQSHTHTEKLQSR